MDAKEKRVEEILETCYLGIAAGDLLEAKKDAKAALKELVIGAVGEDCEATLHGSEYKAAGYSFCRTTILKNLEAIFGKD